MIPLVTSGHNQARSAQLGPDPKRGLNYANEKAHGTWCMRLPGMLQAAPHQPLGTVHQL